MNNVKSFLFHVSISILCVCCVKQPKVEVAPTVSPLFETGNYRSYQEAEKFALDAISFINQDVPTRSGAVRTIVSGVCYSKPATKSEPAADSLFYVFNFSEEAGFAIIAADRQLAPIVAVTERGSFNPGEKTGVKGFDDYMDIVISSFSERERDRLPPHYYFVDQLIGGEVSPLITVRWGQTGVYGQYCPNGISGCVMTATAQIMSYLEKPDTIILSVDMGNDYLAGDTLVLNWPLIKQHLANHTVPMSCNTVHTQIGALMRELGFLFDADYLSSGTSASTADAVNIYSLFDILCSPYSDANITTIKNSLLLSRPVHMRGQTTSSQGHSFIADGYKDYEVWRTKYICQGQNGGYIVEWTRKISESHSLHINWGWDGVCNGYFTFDSYDTATGEEYDTEINTANYDFCQYVKMIPNIRTSN